jgi:hypothetical protein
MQLARIPSGALFAFVHEPVDVPEVRGKALPCAEQRAGLLQLVHLGNA